jgi:hypothetical protein
MNEKPPYTEEEHNELEDLHQDFGYKIACYQIMEFLKTVGYSDVNAVIIEIRKEFLKKRIREMDEKRQEKYKNSTLSQKLCDRLNYTEKLKENGSST